MLNRYHAVFSLIFILIWPSHVLFSCPIRNPLLICHSIHSIALYLLRFSLAFLGHCTSYKFLPITSQPILPSLHSSARYSLILTTKIPCFTESTVLLILLSWQTHNCMCRLPSYSHAAPGTNVAPHHYAAHRYYQALLQVLSPRPSAWIPPSITCLIWLLTVIQAVFSRSIPCKHPSPSLFWLCVPHSDQHIKIFLPKNRILSHRGSAITISAPSISGVHVEYVTEARQLLTHVPNSIVCSRHPDITTCA